MVINGHTHWQSEGEEVILSLRVYCIRQNVRVSLELIIISEVNATCLVYTSQVNPRIVLDEGGEVAHKRTE